MGCRDGRDVLRLGQMARSIEEDTGCDRSRRACTGYTRCIKTHGREKFNVVIWSMTLESNVLQIVRMLQDKIGEILPFFVV